MPNHLQAALDAAVREAAAPGAVALVGRGNEVLFSGASGHRQIGKKKLPAQLDTFYDLASLTKVICTTTSILRLRDEGKLSLDQPLGEHVPLGWGREVTFRHVLTHTGGLPALLPGMKDTVKSLADAVALISKVELRSTPGTRRVYSDLGFVVLAQIVELLEHDTFDHVCAKHIFKPLGMANTGFKPPDAWKENCAATEDCPWRKKVMVGEVHDENAWAIGGVSGHAGLFSTAADLGRFCAGLLAGKVLPKATLDEAAKLTHVPFYPWQALGWKIDPWAGGSEGHLASRSAIGHTGWTGTSMWIDRESGVYSVLLSNTCHPSRDARDNRTLRQVFHRAVNEQLYPRRANIHTGLDRLPWNEFDDIEGKRTAMLTHLAAVDQLGRDGMEVLGLREGHGPRRVFTPEHGLRGAAEAGEKVVGQEGAAEIISLYGEQKAPTPQQLADIDLFIVNLQDIGARYYTYPATMKACMEACAKAGKPMVVLDRANPLGGEVIEGPIAEKVDSLVCAARVPIRHGMTMGEMAQFMQTTEPTLKKLKLSIIELDGWRRDLHWDALAYPWVAPSPNIPDWETALVYVGTCLFEGVNLNEGRGTETPFHIVGAPWLDAEKVIKTIMGEAALGVTLAAEAYVPRSIPGKAAKPTYMDETCQGIRITVTDRAVARPFALSYALLAAIHETHGQKLEWKPFFDVLAGGPGLRKALQGDLSAGRYLEGLRKSLDLYNKTRPRVYA